MHECGEAVVWSIDTISELPEGMQERGLRTFMHSRYAVQPIHTLAQAEHGGEKSRRSSGVPNEQVDRCCFGSTPRDVSPSSVDRDNAIGGFASIGFNAHDVSELHHAVDHHLSVLTP